MKQTTIIAPSLLSANFAHLGDDAKAVLSAGADWLHFDVMDNHFVPNLSFGAMFCKALRDDGITAPIDVHLMVTDANRLIEDFAIAGASSISIHLEAGHDVKACLQRIRALGMEAALAINPDTPVEQAFPYFNDIDMLLIMSVHPGFGGQSFIEASLKKIACARKHIDQSGQNLRLQVDGGVTLNNIGNITKAGADTLVAGSAIFGSKNYAKTLEAFKDNN